MNGGNVADLISSSGFGGLDIIADIDTFDEWVKFVRETNSFLMLSSIGVIFIMVKLLMLLNTQFPSFGVLFYTLGRAKKELFIFVIVSLTLARF